MGGRGREERREGGRKGGREEGREGVGGREDIENCYCTNSRNVPLKKHMTGMRQNHSKERAWLYHQKTSHIG